MRVYKTGVAIAALLAAAAGRAEAQVTATGVIRGQVTLAATGDPIHGATVIVVGARRQGITGEDGRYEIANVPSGKYEVLAQREHFSSGRETVEVTAGGTVTVDFRIALAQVHEEVTVTTSATGATTTFESFSSVKSLDSTELARSRGATIADALANQPGIAIRSFGAGSARPIIRGFDGDRVLVMQDGVRTGDLSSQSGDHGMSIDPASLDRLEVVRGPATLLYGSNAIGGVVNAITPQDAFRQTPFNGLLGGVSFDAGSANGQAGVNGSIQYGRGAWTAWAGSGSRRTGDYDTPAGVIENSATRLTSGRAGIGWVGTRAHFSLGGQVEGNRYGIPFANEFHGQGHDEGHDEEDIAVDIKTIRRDLRVDAGLRHLTGAFEGVKFVVATTRYGHDELEIEGTKESVGTQFVNRTTSLRIEAEQAQRGRLTGRMGIEWLGRQYDARGAEALAPDTRQRAFSAFVYEEMAMGRWRTQFGGRVERTSYAPGPRPPHGHDDHDQDDHEAPPVRDRAFTGASASFGLRTDLTPTSALVVNLTTSARAPALEELYNFGAHVGNLAFEIGNPDLDLERTLGIDLSLRRRASRATGELNFYSYRIHNFVFLDFTGDLVDGLREADFLQGDSRFVGFEASGTVDLGRAVHVRAAVSGVRATLLDTGEALPRIPPVSGRVGLDLLWRGVSILPEVLFTARQGRVFRDEAPTQGWAALNLGASFTHLRGHSTHTLAFRAYNLTNEAYRLHTSFIKDLALEVGRGAQVTYTIRFF